jgi:signal transduction histidine kinase
MRRPRRSVGAMLARARVLDVALAGLSAALTVLAIVGVTFAQSGPVSGSRWWTLPLLLVPAAALLLRRTSPLVCVVGVWVPIALHAGLTGAAAEGLFLVVPGWLSLYALAAYGSRRQLVAGLGVTVISLVVHDLFDPAAWRSGGTAAWSAAFWNLLLFVSALLGGWVAGARRARRLAAENAALERRRRAEAHRAVQEERARVARELHDAVTHNINIVVLQAMAASGVLDDNPDRVREPLTVIEHRAREALEEMRRMLGVLRDAGS